MAESSALTLQSATRVVALLLAVGLTGCIDQEEILSATATGGTPGTAGDRGLTAGASGEGEDEASGGGPLPSTLSWSESNCYEALARGTDGDACAGAFSCDGVSRDCCQWSAACLSGSLSVTETCAACGCQADDDCPFGLLCEAGQCVDCPLATTCPFPFAPTLRNGCAVCVAVGDCSNDAECGADALCYPGRNCLPGCFEDASCCSGNLCAAPGCGSTAELDCSIVGCNQGGACDVVDPGHFCTCEDGRWLCSLAAENSCIYR